MKSSNSSDSSKGLGNTKPSPTKQISPAVRWCFTFNNYSKEDKELLVPLFEEFCKVVICGEEVGAKGTPHLQGYLEFKSKKRPLSVFSQFSGIHWEKAKGSKTDNINYCSKDANIFYNLGLPKPLKKLACEDNLFDWQKDIVKIIEKEPDDRSILWYWSKSGNIGKTTFCKYLCRKYGAICLSGKSSDMKNGIIEYQKTNGFLPEFIIINIPRSFNNEYLSYTGIEEVKDMFFYSGKYEGGMVNGNCPHLLIMANEQPDFNKMSSDRWFVKNIDSPQGQSASN